MLTRLKKLEAHEGCPTFRLEDDSVLLWKPDSNLVGDAKTIAHFSLVVMNPRGIRDVLSLKSPKQVTAGHAGNSVAATYENYQVGVFKGTNVTAWQLPQYSNNVDETTLKELEPNGVLHLEGYVTDFALDHYGYRLAVITNGCLYVYDVSKDAKDMECIAADDKVGDNAKRVFFLSHETVVVYDEVTKKSQRYDIQK